MNCDCVMVLVYSKRNDRAPLYLLLKRNPGLGGYWQPVTGFIEGEESLEAAGLRELKEETGISDFLRVINTGYRFFFNMEDKLCTVGVVAVEVAYSHHRAVKISFEHTDYCWLPYENAREALYWENNKKSLDNINRLLVENRNNSVG